MKKFVSGLLTGIVLSLSVTAFAAVPNIKSAVFTDKISIEINGTKKPVEVISVVKEGEVNARNFVSAADLATALGANVNWNGEKQAVEITNNETHVLQAPKPFEQNDEWIYIADLPNLTGYTLIPYDDKFELYEYDKNTGDKELIISIKYEDSSSPIRTKKVDNLPYVNKDDLIKQGLIKN